MRHCGVAGSPIGHSLSPALHRAAYDTLGLRWTYDAFDLTERDLPGFLESRGPAWRGLSVTMPLKRTAFELSASVTGAARDTGAVNTLVRDADGAWHGSNTDVGGLVRALATAGVVEAPRAVIVGAGATATSALAALRDLGVREVEVWVRRPERASALLAVADGWGIGAAAVDLGRVSGRTGAGACDLAVSTVPAPAQSGAWVEHLARRAAVVHDVVYHPWPTPLVEAARAAEASVVGGFELLLHQAVLQVAAMTGRSEDEVPIGAMRDAGLAALSAR